MCVVLPFILDVRFVDVPTGVRQEEGHTGFLVPSALLAFIFFARKIQSSLSLVDRVVEFCELMRRCPLLATFLSVLFCLISLLISERSMTHYYCNPELLVIV